jgi:hypothetical protein
MARAEAVVTKAVFRQALRVRIQGKQDANEADDPVREADGERSPSPSPTPSSVTAAPSEAHSAGGPAKGSGRKADKEDETQRAKQMIGRIHNLVAADVEAMRAARDFPQLCPSFPARPSSPRRSV